jgi:hypothetical protein
MLTFLAILTAGMVMTLVLVMAGSEAPPTPARTRSPKVASRSRR